MLCLAVELLDQLYVVLAPETHRLVRQLNNPLNATLNCLACLFPSDQLSGKVFPQLQQIGESVTNLVSRELHQLL